MFPRSLLIILALVILIGVRADCQIVSPGNQRTPELKETPELKAYLKIVYDAIGARWYRSVVDKEEWAKLGTIRVDFLIDRNGRVKNLKILDHTGGHVSEEVARDAIEHVSLPPIPKRLRSQLHTPDLECDVKFTIFDNKKQ